MHQVQVEDKIEAWHKLLDCDCLDVAHVEEGLDIWVDDYGLSREPDIYPMFQWRGYAENLAGYGLMLCHNMQGESTSVSLEAIPAEAMLKWEEWERRLNPEDYFDQLSRIYPNTYGTYGLGAKEIEIPQAKTILICCLCGLPIIDDKFGHNPYPLREKGRCCTKCNQEKVIPARLKRIQGIK